MTSTTTKRAPIVRIQATRERTLVYEAAITTPAALANAARAILAGYDREAFAVFHLDTKHRIVSAEIVAVGTLNACLIHPREVFKGACLANAHAVAVAHNHPSGDPTPSPEDRNLTRQLAAAGRVMGIDLLDHLVIGEPGHVSLRDTSPQLWTEGGNAHA